METMKLPQENQESKEKKLETLKIIHKKKNRNSKIRIFNKNKISPKRAFFMFMH